MTGLPLRGPPTPMKPRLYPQRWQSQHAERTEPKLSEIQFKDGTTNGIYSAKVAPFTVARRFATPVYWN